MTSINIPSTMRAIKIKERGTAAVVPDAPVPALRPGYVLVKVTHLGLNPTDWKHVHMEALASPGRTLGIDLAGTIAAVGPDTSRQLQIGDRVAAGSHGVASYDPAMGAYGEYALCREYFLHRLPAHMPSAAGATLPTATVTIGQALYQTLGLPLPDTLPARAGPPQPLLVYGGSSAMGLFALQLARLSGMHPIVAACSPRNFARVRAAGADAVVDYADADACAAAMRAAAGGAPRLALDCIAEGDSGRICAGALTAEPGVARYVCLLLGAEARFPRDDVALKTWVLGSSAFGEAYRFTRELVFERSEEDAEYARMFFGVVERLLAAGKVTAIPYEERQGGLEGALEGMEEMRAGKVSGQKLVYAMP